MRVLIKIDLYSGRGKKKIPPFQDDDDAKISEGYINKVTSLFKGMNFHTYTRENYGDSPFSDLVNKSYENVPEDVKEEELERNVLVGFTSEGQLHFVVTAINPDRLHLRAQSDLFFRMQNASKEIMSKLPSASKCHYYKLRGIPHLKVIEDIQVMEVGQRIHTITGKVLSSFRKVLHQTFKETTINIVLFFVGIVFFLYVLKDHNWDYGQILTAPIFPAILLFLATNTVPVFITFARLFVGRPISWSSFSLGKK